MIKIHCAHDELVPVEDLKPHPKNRNKHSDAQIKRLADIIKYQGFRYPIKVSKLSGFITSGHGRLAAAKLLGMTHAPVSFQEYESAEQEYADVISDNSIASWAELDLAGINEDLSDLGPDFDIELLGIKNFTLEIPDDNQKPVAELDLSDDAKKPIEVQCPDCGHDFVVEV